LALTSPTSGGRSVGIVRLRATDWTAGGFDSREVHDFSLLHSAQTGSAAHLTSYPKCGGCDPPGVWWSGREADHSPPSSDEVKNDGATPPLPLSLHDTVLNELSTGTTFTFS
jgi:hypothetical protein